MTKQHSRNGVNINKSDTSNEVNNATDTKVSDTPEVAVVQAAPAEKPTMQEELNSMAAKLKAALDDKKLANEAVKASKNVITGELEQKLRKKLEDLLKETLADASTDSEESTDINITLFDGFKKPEPLKQHWFATLA